MKDILQDLNRMLDHSALKPDVNEKAVIQLCEEAIKYNFCAVCVNPVWARLAADRLKGISIKVVSTVGFPLGANRTDVKATEAAKAVSDGASEIDMAANIGWIKSGEFKKLEDEIAEVRRSIPSNVILKVIIEAPLLTPDEQLKATKAVISGGAQFVKTGTGFFGDATVEQVKNLARAAGGKILVKASGGIKTLEQCRVMLEAGASRIGTSSGVQIMDQYSRPKSA
ncbi:MAG TPA: deoxyribose-phosphate aldolase [candidate division Zixibacteria bacterium]|nr:deoxyribose-phosphate aldolase [candidate division Zixibacteria bacterium]